MIIDSAQARLAPHVVLSSRELGAVASGLAAVLGLEGRPFELRLARDAEVADLNAAYLGCAGPTNVLSFPSEEESTDGFLGSIVLSVDAVTRESFLYGQEPEEHLLRLLAHALLHLAGLDHGPVMEEMTEAAVLAGRAILAQIA